MAGACRRRPAAARLFPLAVLALCAFALLPVGRAAALSCPDLQATDVDVANAATGNCSKIGTSPSNGVRIANSSVGAASHRSIVIWPFVNGSLATPSYTCYGSGCNGGTANDVMCYTDAGACDVDFHYTDDSGRTVTGAFSLAGGSTAVTDITVTGGAFGLPSVHSLSPNTGPAAGGTSVTITGTNFSGATEVKFGARPASAFTVNSATSITATSPAGSDTVDVWVKVGGNTSATTPSDRFTYVAASTVTTTSSLNPSEFGQSVTFTATVTPTSGSGTPTGTVTFMDGAVTLGTPTLAGGIASLTTAALARGSHGITAVYGGSATVAASTSPVLAQTVDMPADSARLRALQVAATRIAAQGSGQAITGAIDTAIADAFAGGGPLISPSGAGLHVNTFAEPPSPDAGGAVAAYATAQPASGRMGEAFTAVDRAAMPTKAGVAAPRPSRDWMLWADTSGFGLGGWTHGATLSGGQVNALVGLSHRATPTLVLGVLGGYESFRYDSREFVGRLRGEGWTLGSYLGWFIVPGVRFDLAGAYSGLGYDATAGLAAGSFEGTRRLLSGGLTGTYRAGGFTVQPSAKVYALWERQTAYTDTLGTSQADRTFTTGRGSAGARVAYALTPLPGTTISPYVGLYGDYYFASDDAAASGAVAPVPAALLHGFSARGLTGVAATFANGASVSLAGELGGIGSDTMLWRASAGVHVPF